MSLDKRFVMTQSGQAAFGNAYVKSALASSIQPGATVIHLADSSQFASSGVVWTEPVSFTYTANNTSTSELTLDATNEFPFSVGGPAYQPITPVAQVDIYPEDGSRVGEMIQGADDQTADLSQWRQADGTVLAAIDAGGFLKPRHAADTNAPNDSLYFSTTAGKLVYKDPSGAVNALY